MHLATIPDVRARDCPDHTAVGDGAVEVTNAEFHDRIRAAASVLRARGVGSGDVVAAMLPNSIAMATMLFAAWRIGASVTPMNPRLSDAEARYQLSDSGAVILVTTDECDLPITVVTTADLDRQSLNGDDPSPGADPNLDATALIIYTSGTTGQPKGVMLDHHNLQAMCDMALRSIELGPSDHCLLILPMFHVNALIVSVCAPLLAGARTSIAGQFSPESFVAMIRRLRPTYFSAVPTILGMLTELPESQRVDFSSLRVAICGAAPMPPGLAERFERRFGVPVVEGYGLSEGTCASTINPLNGPRKAGTVGLPMAGQHIAIMGPDGQFQRRGHTGEVVLRGPNVMRGYLNRPAETAKTIVDGWLHTGDVGRFDEDGYLVLLDRIKDMIIRGGENVYPKEIESVLYEHGHVAEAAVIGRPDNRLGEVPLAFISGRADSALDTDELYDLCRARLAKYKWPAEIVEMDTLPKNSVGKVDKPALRALPTLQNISARGE